MPNPIQLEADYLVIGAGAVGMAFVDTMLTETEASFIIVDRHHMPGGHWNDAYPFVRLHQPSAFYGVNSTHLGSDRIDVAGPNKGYYELASGPEVTAYFEKVMRERFLPSGRVQYFPMSDYTGEGTFRSMMSDQAYQVAIGKKTVDSTFFKTSVPSTHTRPYAVDPGVTCIAPNDLPKLAGDYDTFVVLGGGKTAMDTSVWLLNNGADPEAVSWVCPRDSWLITRASTQPGETFFQQSMGGFAHQLESIRDASSVDDIFLRMEATGQMVRIDTTVLPTMFHFATISDGEVEQLRRIGHVIKGRHVSRIGTDGVHLSDGETVPMDPATLYIDCTASAVPFRDQHGIPIFTDDRIVIQAVRAPLVTFSSALIAYVEAHVEGLDAQNALCTPIKLADTPTEWMHCFALNMMNQQAWSSHPKVGPWLSSIRLDPFASMVQAVGGATEENAQTMARIGTAAGPAMANLQKLMATEAARAS